MKTIFDLFQTLDFWLCSQNTEINHAYFSLFIEETSRKKKTVHRIN